MGGEKPYGESVKEKLEEPAPTDTFRKALAYTFANEGGFSNVKEDKGGATNFGIIREELARWRHHDVTAEDVRNMDRAEAEAIYKAWYWDALHLSQVTNEKVAMALFDRAVLNGLTGVSRHVRNIFPGVQKEDAPNFFPLMSLVNAHDPHSFVLKLADLCEKAHRRRVEQDPTQQRFLAGWLNRVNRMRKELT